MKKILHLSYDLRDRHNREVTTAVSNLINISRSQFDPFIIDLVRVTKPQQEMIQMKNPGHLMINVFGLPYGFLMNWSQDRAFKRIKKAESQKLITLNEFSMVHAHKLTFEGIAGYKLASHLNIPFMVTLRQTDTYVFNRKPGAVETFKPIIKSCGRFIYLIPQILKRMKKIFGEDFFEKYIEPKAVHLSNIVERNILTEDSGVDRNVLLTVMRMTKKSVERKNLKRLLMAFQLINREDVKLRIIGDGEYFPTVRSWVNDFGLNDKVIFEGAIPNEEIDKYYKSTHAFLLPSISETFGMVYAESLLNGTPIMFSKDYLGFDGYFEGVGAGVDPKSVESIKNGIVDLLDNSDNYRKKIDELEKLGEFKIFSSEYVTEKYNRVLSEEVNN
jgi:glycosyltransferase involved in cell wall biosynthesis